MCCRSPAWQQCTYHLPSLRSVLGERWRPPPKPCIIIFVGWLALNRDPYKELVWSEFSSSGFCCVSLKIEWETIYLPQRIPYTYYFYSIAVNCQPKVYHNIGFLTNGKLSTCCAFRPDLWPLRTSSGGRCGSVVVEVLCYKPEGRGFETLWGIWFFSPNLHNPSSRSRPFVYVILLQKWVPEVEK
jgi:hypothetical protein